MERLWALAVSRSLTLRRTRMTRLCLWEEGGGEWQGARSDETFGQRRLEPAFSSSPANQSVPQTNRQQDTTRFSPARAFRTCSRSAWCVTAHGVVFHHSAIHLLVRTATSTCQWQSAGVTATRSSSQLPPFYLTPASIHLRRQATAAASRPIASPIVPINFGYTIKVTKSQTG